MRAPLVATAGLALLAALAAVPAAVAYPEGPPVDHVRIRWPMTPPDDCTSCHDGFANSFPGSLDVFVRTPAEEPLPAEYEPGRTYELLVRLADPDMDRSRWGFELAAVTDDFQPGGDLAQVAADPGVQIVFDGLRQLEFAMQRLSGSFQSEWQLRWTAPDATAGDLGIFLCANAGDGDGSSDGDHIFCRDYAIAGPACAVVPAAIERLQGVRAGDDIVWGYRGDPAADGGYRLYAVGSKRDIPDANASMPGALRDCPAPTATDLSCTETGALLDATSPLFYQLVGVCLTGEEGPN